MSEGSSRSSQEGLDGLHGGGRQPTPPRTVPGSGECRPHLPVTRVCTSPGVASGRPRLQLNLSPSATPHLNSQSGGVSPPQASGQAANPASRPQRGANACDGVPDGGSPPPYNAHHRLTNSQSSPQLATAQRRPPQPGRQSVAGESPMAPHSLEWQDWQRDRWQIWQLLSSDNADTLPETLV